MLQGYNTETAPSVRKRTVHEIGDVPRPYTPLKVTKRRKVVHDHAYLGAGDPIVLNKHDLDENTMTSPVRTSGYSVAKMCNEHNYATDDSKSSQIVFSPKTGFEIAIAHQNELKKERDEYLREVNYLKFQLQNLKTPTLTLDSLRENDRAIKLHTGLPSYAVFMFLYNQLEKKIVSLQYHTGNGSESKNAPESAICRKGPGRSLDKKNEMLLTLMKLKLNLLNEDLAFRFDISPALVSRIITTWIIFLGLELQQLIVWPKFDVLKQYYPKCFDAYDTVCCIIDCTEVSIQRCSLAESNCKCYSSYKGKPTAKVLIGCMPGGAISFISDVFCGSISDRDIVLKSDFLPKLEMLAHEALSKITVLADRGFNIQDLLLQYGVQLESPPFLKQKQQFSSEKAIKTKRVANSRVHVERVIGRLKEFKIFKSVIPTEYYDLLYFVFIICAAIVNLNPPVVKLE